MGRAAYHLKNDVELSGRRGHEFSVLQGTDERLDASELPNLLRFLLSADERGDIELRVLGDDLEDRGTHKTCITQQ